MSNPFADDFEELVNLDSRYCTDMSIVRKLQKLESTGKKQYEEFAKAVFREQSKLIHDPIKRNSITIYFAKSTCRQGPNGQNQGLTKQCITL